MKVRFIIEKQNGYLKNLQGLENIRNTIAGHIQIDYRIACAMYNLFHKPCCPDGVNGKLIAQRMKNKITNERNRLEFLLKKQFDTADINKFNLDEIVDFPKLKKKQLIRKVFFGTFYIRQSISYMKELITSNIVYSLNSKYIKKIDDDELRNDLIKYESIVIGCEILSRHHRGQNKETGKFTNIYKIFVEYIPELNSPKAIKSKRKKFTSS